MEIKTYRLCTAREMDIVKTFECGQCFRWNADKHGKYTGVAGGFAAELWEEDGSIIISGGGSEAFWREYFDLDRNYEAISSGFNGGEYLDRCVEFGRGIRILRQEPWEAMCSFIISQCNNIPRIKGIVERLCNLAGNPVYLGETEYRSFPGAETVAALSLEELAVLRSGYRARYILDAAKSVAEGRVDPERLKQLDYRSAKKELLAMNGIGEKVANCIVLFGLGHLEAFPVDTWIRKALKEHFPPDFNPDSLGEYAGIAQQYIFYYARSTGNE